MTQPSSGPGSEQPGSASPISAEMEAFLSGAVRRIQKSAMVLSLAASLLATIFFGWRNGSALALGAAVAYVNFVWLHRSSEAMVRRMLAPDQPGPSRLKATLLTLARYVFVIAFVYVIFKGYPQLRVAVMVGLVCPILAAMGESAYEAVVLSKTDDTPD